MQCHGGIYFSSNHAKRYFYDITQHAQGFFQCFEICFTFVFYSRTINGKAYCADRPDERKWNPKPLIYYFTETQEICAAEIYKQKNLTSWEVMTIDKDVSNFQRYCTVNQEFWLIKYKREMHMRFPIK
ncbi:hypothetical protein T02_11659 [Trichinella nativa]|uniref:Uncharacterized protein n=1 Tax=Trichinella nativa TaxID=6335 RepID=A0A0V1LS68_9BILA|nr:hypothetical protein T02_11659 [Trichinella nativa]